jgi:hypothetical protein
MEDSCMQESFAEYILKVFLLLWTQSWAGMGVAQPHMYKYFLGGEFAAEGSASTFAQQQLLIFGRHVLQL